MADPDRQIMPLLNQIDETIRQDELDRDLGMALDEMGEQGRDMETAENQRGRDRKLPRGFCPVTLRRPLRFLQIREDASGPLEIARPGIGQPDPAGGAMEKPHAQAAFEGRDLARHDRRRQAEPAGGGREALSLARGKEGRHGIKAVHSDYCHSGNNVLSIGMIISVSG